MYCDGLTLGDILQRALALRHKQVLYVVDPEDPHNTREIPRERMERLFLEIQAEDLMDRCHTVGEVLNLIKPGDAWIRCWAAIKRIREIDGGLNIKEVKTLVDLRSETV